MSPKQIVCWYCGAVPTKEVLGHIVRWRCEQCSATYVPHKRWKIPTSIADKPNIVFIYENRLSCGASYRAVARIIDSKGVSHAKRKA